MKKIGLIISLFSVLFSAGAQDVRAEADFSGLEKRLEKHVYTLAADSMMGRESGSEYSLAAAEYVIGKLREAGVEPYKKETYFQHFSRTNRAGDVIRYQNVVGIIKSGNAEPIDEYVVLGAHLDHMGNSMKDGELVIYNGADDNASGVAALIEVARELVSRRAELKRSVLIIAFDAEEDGLRGSKHFVSSPIVPLNKIKLMMSMDMVGWYETSGKVYYHGEATMKNGKDLLTGSGVLPDGLVVEVQKFEKNALAGTDTEPFARKGIPTLHVTTGLKSPYHTPEDIPELIDYDGLALITTHIANVTAEVCSKEDYKPSGKISPKHRGAKLFTFGLSLNAGSNFQHYTKGAVNGKNAGIFSAGLYSNIRLGGAMALRPEALYERTGAKHPDGKIWLNSVTLPVNIILHTSDESFAGLYVSFGGYYSYRFSGKQDGHDIDFTDTFYRNEGGLSCGLGVRVSRFSLGVVFRYALTEFTRGKNTDGAHIKNRSTFCNISYRF